MDTRALICAVLLLGCAYYARGEYKIAGRRYCSEAIESVERIANVADVRTYTELLLYRNGVLAHARLARTSAC